MWPADWTALLYITNSLKKIFLSTENNASVNTLWEIVSSCQSKDSCPLTPNWHKRSAVGISAISDASRYSSVRQSIRFIRLLTRFESDVGDNSWKHYYLKSCIIIMVQWLRESERDALTTYLPTKKSTTPHASCSQRNPCVLMERGPT